MKNIAIFGCGEAGQAAYCRLRSNCRIVGFLDNNPIRQGIRLHGIPVHDPASYDYSKVDHVFIASMYFDEILGQLLDLGVPPSKIESVSDELRMQSPTYDDGGWRSLSRYIQAARRLSYLPFRLLR